MKAFLTILIAGLLAALAFLVWENRSLQRELIQSQQQSTHDIAKLEAEIAALKHIEVDRDELARLRKDNRDLNRLRNEIGLLRNSPAAKGISEQQWEQILGKNQQLQRERDALVAERERAPRIGCINNLRIIQGAKKQWAAEAGQPDTATPTAEQIAPYLPSPFPVCPGDGVYTFKSVHEYPTCSTAGHVLTAENF